MTRPGRQRPTPDRLLPAAIWFAVSVCGLQAQTSRPATAPLQTQETRPLAHPDEGKIVRDILVEGARFTTAEQITYNLRTRTGQPLKLADVQEDLRMLWLTRRIQPRFEVEDVEGGVRVVISVLEHPNFERVVFKGLNHFSESQVKSILGLPTAGMNKVAALNYALSLQERYRNEGYYHAKVRLAEDEKTSTLTFLVDEGPKVTVRSLQFRGNAAHAGEPGPFGWGRSVAGGAKMDLKTGWLFLAGSPFALKTLEDDLEKIRFFYRRNGYRDAIVELADLRFSDAKDEVDLAFRVVEGPRYVITAVDLEQRPPAGRQEPLYPKQQVMEVLKVKPGEPYDRDRINYDLAALEEFYGKRGHPRKNKYGRGLESAFDVDEPLEVFDPVKPELRLVYRLEEGTPKKLHDIRIRGNTETKDRVIRRKVLAKPDETLDMTKVDKSLSALDALQYFQDENQLSAIRFELLPVEGTGDQVDLAIDVQEGNTGQLLWGIGISSGNGVQGRMQILKRNFDIGRGPSSWDPITLFEEILGNKAFHGGGQTLDLSVAPGTKVSLFSLTFFEPDLFKSHQDTIGLRTRGFRGLQTWDSFRTDTLGASLGLERNFNEDFSIGLSMRQENVEVKDVQPYAPEIVWDAKGSTELRGLRVNSTLRSLDRYVQPTKGFEARASAELLGGPFGTDENLYKFAVMLDLYFPIWRDDRDRSHVLRLHEQFDYAHAYSDTDDVYLTERYYMGGASLRGFRHRGAGPTQFDQPLGGEVRYLQTLEYAFPIWSTPVEGRFRETEILRGVVFSDFGLLGLGLHDPTFAEPRLSVGLGIRIQVPLLGLPIELDLGWPLLWEETDHRHQFYFSLGR